MARDFKTLGYCGLNCVVGCPERAYPETCSGCKGEGLLAPLCTTCTIRQCASAHGLPTCAHCEEYPTCTVELWQRFPILRTVIERLRADLPESPVV